MLTGQRIRPLQVRADWHHPIVGAGLAPLPGRWDDRFKASLQGWDDRQGPRSLGVQGCGYIRLTLEQHGPGHSSRQNKVRIEMAPSSSSSRNQLLPCFFSATFLMFLASWERLGKRLQMDHDGRRVRSSNIQPIGQTCDSKFRSSVNLQYANVVLRWCKTSHKKTSKWASMHLQNNPTLSEPCLIQLHASNSFWIWTKISPVHMSSWSSFYKSTCVSLEMFCSLDVNTISHIFPTNLKPDILIHILKNGFRS